LSAVPRPIVIAHHLIMTAYGWWLPNDPRGGTSNTVANDVIAELGELHHGRRTIQPPSDAIAEFYLRAKEVLRFPLLEFGRQEVHAIADAFAEGIHRHRYTCYACAVMRDHVHLLIRKHRHKAEEMIENLQALSRKRVCAAGFRDGGHPMWARSGWKVFLDRPDAIRRTIGYIKANPGKQRHAVQQWPFVTEYDGWPLHPGHSPNSPYARRLRGESR